MAALRLARAGHEVHGLHMTNWDDGDCTAADDYQSARMVCDELSIPLHRADFSAEYRERVFSEFLREYRAGRTPNPDVLCNRHIKFGCFLDYATRLGADQVATGHYARVGGVDGRRLLMAADRQKDQTYFLHAVAPEALARTLFPLGDLTKAQVRRLAIDAGLPNHARPDSTGICFIGERPFREFLARYIPAAAGPVMTIDGVEVGQHDGLMFYTIGQRSGIRIGGRADSADLPWYVARKDAEKNALVIVQGREHPLLWSRQLETEPARWLAGGAPPVELDSPFRCQARIRHRHVPAGCLVTQRRDGSLTVRFEQAQWAPAPGQYVVIYDGEECLGGAVISSSARAAPPAYEDVVASSYPGAARKAARATYPL